MKDFSKYSYFMESKISLPEPWQQVILKMCEQIDNEIRPWYLSRAILCAIKSNRDNGFNQPKFLTGMLDACTSQCQIKQIKSKFATLQITGSFNTRCQSIVSVAKSTCNNTCEACGEIENVKHVGISGWVTNLCPNCTTKLKKNDTSDGINSCLPQC